MRIRIPYGTNPVPDPGFWLTKLEKIYIWKFLCIFWIKNCKKLIPRPPQKDPKLQEMPSTSKENIQYFKTWKFFTFLYFCGSFLPFLIQIRIQQLKLMRIHADLDPQPCNLQSDVMMNHFYLPYPRMHSPPGRRSPDWKGWSRAGPGRAPPPFLRVRSAAAAPPAVLHSHRGYL